MRQHVTMASIAMAESLRGQLYPSIERSHSLSHIVSIKVQMKDADVLAAACRRLGLAAPVHETVELFSGNATGLAVRLPNWQYPIVVDITAGEMHYDDYNGEWGDKVALDRLIQAYAVERTRMEARRKGFACTETVLQDGSVKLQILEGA
jgi:hypothetical protein